jgi:UDP-N-acetylglucosamine kinase
VSLPETNKYVLKDAENEQIFWTGIVPQRLSGAVKQSSPVLVIVGSQTGAGKSFLTLRIKDLLSRRGGAIHINMDFYNPHHPHYETLRSTDPAHADAYLRPDGDRWWKLAQDYVIEHRVDALLESAMQTKAEFEDIICRFDAAEYQVEVALMAVPAALSRQGILSRYAQELHDLGQGRLVDASIHDLCFEGVLRGAGAVDRGAPRTVRVFRRGNDEVYVNCRTPKGTWDSLPPAAREAVTIERGRRLASHEATSFEAVHARLTSELGPQFWEELATIKMLAASVLGSAPP